MAREKAPLPNAAPADDKKRAIDTAMAQIERMYGKGAIMRFGDKAELNVNKNFQGAGRSSDHADARYRPFGSAV